MALVKFGGGIIQMAGSVGGTTFARNRYGNYARAKTKPVNPQSPRQSEIRSIVSAQVATWRGDLSQANRDAWGVFASNVPAKNKLGEVINLSGFNQFVKSAVTAANAALSVVFAGPVVFALPGEDPSFEASVDAGTGKITVTFDENLDWVNQNNAGLIVQMGLPQNDSIEFFNGPWRHAGVIEGQVAIPPTSPDATIDVPFEVADGQKIFVRAKIIEEDGRVSDWFRINTTVATA